MSGNRIEKTEAFAIADKWLASQKRIRELRRQLKSEERRCANLEHEVFSGGYSIRFGDGDSDTGTAFNYTLLIEIDRPVPYGGPPDASSDCREYFENVHFVDTEGNENERQGN